MKDIGYGEGYRYDHAEDGHAAGQEYLPDALRGTRWYEPGNTGYEKTIAERLAWWRQRKNETLRQPPSANDRCPDDRDATSNERFSSLCCWPSRSRSSG